MQEISKIFQSVLPIVQEWIRATVHDEIVRALEGEREKQKPNRQLTRKEVCSLLHISLPTLWSMTRDGRIKATHVGRRILYDEVEVRRFLK